MTALPLAFSAAASDFSSRYPAGSIRDTAAAQTALKDAEAELARIAQNAKARDAECFRGFFVNSCRDDVRREKELAEREVKRVQLEANDFKRRLDAEELKKRRAEQSQAGAIDDAKRTQEGAAARAASDAREADSKQRNEDAAKRSTGALPTVEPQRPPAKDRLTAEERAENVRKYQQKQEEAAKRATEAEAQRKQNEQRRAERRKQIEEREAQREAVRKKAEETLK